jgi:RNA polymerase sigma-B factor
MSIGRKDETSLNALAESYFAQPTDEKKAELVDAAHAYVLYFIRLYGGAARKDDLYQVGMEGLLKAIRDFDPDRKVLFSTYAGNKIMGDIRHWVRKEASYYRPGSIVSLQFKVDAIIDKWFKENGVMPTPEQVAAELGIRADGIKEVMRAGLVSYDEIDVEAIHSDRYRSFELPIEDRLLLSQLYTGLSDLQKKIWHLLFERRLSQEKAASELGMTQKQVSREKEKMVQKMRREVQGNKEKRKE